MSDLCDSELRGVPEDRYTGLSQGDRKLRSYSHTAAGTASRGDQEDTLRRRFTRFKTDLYGSDQDLIRINRNNTKQLLRFIL